MGARPGGKGKGGGKGKRVEEEDEEPGTKASRRSKAGQEIPAALLVPPSQRMEAPAGLPAHIAAYLPPKRSHKKMTPEQRVCCIPMCSGFEIIDAVR